VSENLRNPLAGYASAAFIAIDILWKRGYIVHSMRARDEARDLASQVSRSPWDHKEQS